MAKFNKLNLTLLNLVLSLVSIRNALLVTSKMMYCHSFSDFIYAKSPPKKSIIIWGDKIIK